MSAAVIFGLFSITMAENIKASENSDQKKQTLEKSERDEKKAAKKSERAHKILAACEKAMEKAQAHAKHCSGPQKDKKDFDLYVAHAELEMKAAQDSETDEDRLQHARLCKRYIGKADKLCPQDDKVFSPAEIKGKEKK